VIESYHYNEAARVFDLKYEQAKSCSAPTEVFLPSSPAEIKVSGGEYELAEYGDGYCLKWKTESGNHTLKVQI